MRSAQRKSLFVALGLAAIVASSALACEEQAIMHPRVTLDPPNPPPVVAKASAAAPAASLPDWHKNDANPENKVGQFTWDNVNPKFVAAVASYSSELRQLVAGKIEITAVGRCLKDLGDAIATVPHPTGVDVQSAGERIRIEAARASGAAPAPPGQPAPQKDSIKAALTIASATFAELGRGPYKVEGVVNGNRELEEAVPDITPLGALESHQNEIYRSLQRVEPILRAIEVEAAKRPAR